MWKSFLPIGNLIVFCSVLALSNTACNSNSLVTFTGEPVETPTVSPSPSPSSSPSPQKSASPVTEPTKIAHTYQDAIATASGAVTISKSAVSRDDWSLVANRWQEAINLLQNVPVASADYAKAQAKLAEYERHLADAKVRSTPPPEKPEQGDASPKFFSASIKARLRGIPVIEVTFDDDHKFDMVFDTGASSTLVTASMAYTLQLQTVGTKLVTVADGAIVELPISLIKSIEIDGRLKRKVPVAVAPATMPIGLLGQDFFEGYDVTIKQNVIEFRKQ